MKSFREDDVISYVNVKKKTIVATINNANIGIVKMFGVDCDFSECYLVITRNGHLVIKSDEELTLVKSIRHEKMLRLLSEI